MKPTKPQKECKHINQESVSGKQTLDNVFGRICGDCGIELKDIRPLSPPKPQTEGWIDNYLDKIWRFGIEQMLQGKIDKYDLINLIEEQIKLLLAKQREEIKNKVGFLRQWLNEKDKSRLVSNKDIEIWLEL